MPLIQVFTTATPSAAAGDALLADLSRVLSEHLRKPEAYVMTSLVPGLSMTFAGKTGPTCFVVVRSIGKMTPKTTEALSQDICSRITGALGVPGDRTYIEFGDAVGHLWGWNGGTFG